MSTCIRPVIESWGAPMTYVSRETDIADLLLHIARPCEECLTTEVYCYGDIQVVYFSDGKAFLDYLISLPINVIMSGLANDGYTNADDKEYARQVEDVSEIVRMVGEWRASIDPGDGSLRIYCD